MASALHSFVEMQHAHKLLILGDMLELGAESQLEHQKILDFLKENQLQFVTVGPIFKGLNNAGFENTASLKAYITNNPIEDHLILLKGSRGIALEQVLEQL
jgi:UDP-N-acetylmuramoyl-tripeptide--D-alanyl-D-alanine ligase